MVSPIPKRSSRPLLSEIPITRRLQDPQSPADVLHGVRRVCSRVETLAYPINIVPSPWRSSLAANGAVSPIPGVQDSGETLISRRVRETRIGLAGAVSAAAGRFSSNGRLSRRLLRLRLLPERTRCRTSSFRSGCVPRQPDHEPFVCPPSQAHEGEPHEQLLIGRQPRLMRCRLADREQPPSHRHGLTLSVKPWRIRSHDAMIHAGLERIQTIRQLLPRET